MENEFYLQYLETCQASLFAFGAVLEQDGHLVWCCSKALKGYQSRWHILLKEFYAIVFACSKFDYYIDGQPNVPVFIDHKALKYILDGKLSDKLYRWVLILLKHHVKYITGEDNAAVNALTRLRQKIRLPDDTPSNLEKISLLSK